MRIGEYPERPAQRTDDGDRDRAGWPHAAVDTPLSPDPLDTSEAQILLQLGFGKPLVAAMAERAARYGTTIEQELLGDGWIDPDAYYAALARMLRLPYLSQVNAEGVADVSHLDSQLVQPATIRLQHARQAPVTVIVPEARRVPMILGMLDRLPDLRHSLAVAAGSTVRQAVWKAGAPRRLQQTIGNLFENNPKYSARIVLWGRQGFYTGVGVTTAALGTLIAPSLALLTLHVLMSSLYFISLWLKFFAIRYCREPAQPILPLPEKKDLPVYTVMVALYREATVAAQLVATLRRLNWPPSLLDIKLVCEADDRETIEALEALRPGPQFEIVEVPPMQPRTKPKALSYALPAARGEFLAIYDAEDRPHPDQLLEAYGRFAKAPQTLACVQAPLIITNARASWLSALFSLEYSALFRALLPMLARAGMPLPLGGTSNHFRTAVLRKAGGGDPYNVTEDADLGMRLYRLGYRADVIVRHTLEDAPTTLKSWCGQRTRWYKGWLQTWLVMMRDPRQLVRDMGWKAFIVFQLMIGGMLVSSLAHPFILLFFFVTLVAMLDNPATDIHILAKTLFTIDIVNIFGSYSAFLAVGAAAMIHHEKKLVGWRWVLIPVYWMLVSFSAWRAVVELKTRPFFWHKTQHQPHAQTDPAKSARPYSHPQNVRVPR